MKNNQRAVRLAVATLVAALAVPATGQERPEARIDDFWFPASEVLNPDGTLTPEFANSRPVPTHTGIVTTQDIVHALGLGVKRWQKKAWMHAGRASELGLEDGTVLIEDRSHCIGDMRNVSPHHWAGPPKQFAEWVAKSRAIVEVQVAGIFPGFSLRAEPVMILRLNVLRHFFEPSRPFPHELRWPLPVGEFVAGDAVFCRKATWGAYRPKVGDRMVIGTFSYPGSQDLLDVIEPSQIFLVEQEGNLRRLGGTSVDEGGFPASLESFAYRVHDLELAGALSDVSLYDELREAGIMPNHGEATLKREQH